MNIKNLCLLAGILLIGAIFSFWPYSYFIILRWLVFIISLIVLNGFYTSNLKGWAIVFGVIALLFNPIYPVYLNKQSWIPIDLVSAIFFFLAAYSIKKKE